MCVKNFDLVEGVRRNFHQDLGGNKLSKKGLKWGGGVKVRTQKCSRAVCANTIILSLYSHCTLFYVEVNIAKHIHNFSKNWISQNGGAHEKFVSNGVGGMKFWPKAIRFWVPPLSMFLGPSHIIIGDEVIIRTCCPNSILAHLLYKRICRARHASLLKFCLNSFCLNIEIDGILREMINIYQ